MDEPNKILKKGNGLNAKKYRTVTAKTKLYPYGVVENHKVDSIKRSNPALGKQIGEPYTERPGYQPQYGTAQSDLIKGALKK